MKRIQTKLPDELHSVILQMRRDTGMSASQLLMIGAMLVAERPVEKLGADYLHAISYGDEHGETGDAADVG